MTNDPPEPPAVMAVPSLLYWCDSTWGEPVETGIPRVTRRLALGLAGRGLAVTPVGWNRRARQIKRLAPERQGDDALTGADAPAGSWLLAPDIPHAILRDDLDPMRIGRAYDLRVAAIVHDLIPLRLAQHYDPATLALHRRYYAMFAEADLVLATTGRVARHLRGHLVSEGLRAPPIAVAPLPAQFSDQPRRREPPPARGPGDPLRLLTVSTWEPRKNLLGLLRGILRAEAQGAPAIHLTIVGRRGLFPDHDARILALLAEMPRAVVVGRPGDEALAALHRDHHASVYPSWEEGFGLPILESLWLGRPCLCHDSSSMAEVAPGGGALMLDMTDEAALAAALVAISREPALLDRLQAEAAARPLRDWRDYAGDVAALLGIA